MVSNRTIVCGAAGEHATIDSRERECECCESSLWLRWSVLQVLLQEDVESMVDPRIWLPSWLAVAENLTVDVGAVATLDLDLGGSLRGLLKKTSASRWSVNLQLQLPRGGPRLAHVMWRGTDMLATASRGDVLSLPLPMWSSEASEGSLKDLEMDLHPLEGLEGAWNGSLVYAFTMEGTMLHVEAMREVHVRWASPTAPAPVVVQVPMHLHKMLLMNEVEDVTSLVVRAIARASSLMVSPPLSPSAVASMVELQGCNVSVWSAGFRAGFVRALVGKPNSSRLHDFLAMSGGEWSATERLFVVQQANTPQLIRVNVNVSVVNPLSGSVVEVLLQEDVESMVDPRIWLPSWLAVAENLTVDVGAVATLDLDRGGSLRGLLKKTSASRWSVNLQLQLPRGGPRLAHVMWRGTDMLATASRGDVLSLPLPMWSSEASEGSLKDLEMDLHPLEGLEGAWNGSLVYAFTMEGTMLHVEAMREVHVRWASPTAPAPVVVQVPMHLHKMLLMNEVEDVTSLVVRAIARASSLMVSPPLSPSAVASMVELQGCNVSVWSAGFRAGFVRALVGKPNSSRLHDFLAMSGGEWSATETIVCGAAGEHATIDSRERECECCESSLWLRCGSVVARRRGEYGGSSHLAPVVARGR